MKKATKRNAASFAAVLSYDVFTLPECFMGRILFANQPNMWTTILAFANDPTIRSIDEPQMETFNIGFAFFTKSKTLLANIYGIVYRDDSSKSNIDRSR